MNTDALLARVKRAMLRLKPKMLHLPAVLIDFATGRDAPGHEEHNQQSREDLAHLLLSVKEYGSVPEWNPDDDGIDREPPA